MCPRRGYDGAGSSMEWGRKDVGVELWTGWMDGWCGRRGLRSGAFEGPTSGGRLSKGPGMEVSTGLTDAAAGSPWSFSFASCRNMCIVPERCGMGNEIRGTTLSGDRSKGVRLGYASRLSLGWLPEVFFLGWWGRRGTGG